MCACVYACVGTNEELAHIYRLHTKDKMGQYSRRLGVLMVFGISLDIWNGGHLKMGD